MTDQDYSMYLFPERNIPDSEKTETWVAKMLMAYWKQWSLYPTVAYGGDGLPLSGAWTVYASPWEMQKLRNFSRALNNGEDQKKAHQLNDADANGAQTAMKIHWDPSMYQWKPMNAIARMMYGRKTELVATAIDPDSCDARDMAMWAELAGIDNANDPKVRELDAAMGIDRSIPKEKPQTREEYQAWTSMGVMDAQATSLTQAIALIHNKSEYDRNVRKRLAEELRDTGFGVVATRMTGAGLPVSRVIPVEYAVFPWTDDNFADPEYAGYIEFLTPQQVLAEAGDIWGEDGKQLLYDLAKYGNSDGRTYFGVAGSMTSTFRRRGKVAVFRGYFKDTNSIAMSKRKGRNGDTIYRQGEGENAKWTTERTNYDVVYKGSYIMGTYDSESTSPTKSKALWWGCGLAYNQARMENDLYTTKIPITIRAYNMTEMRVKSVASIAMIKCIEINELVIQLRTFIRKSIPPGLMYNIDAIMRTMTDLNLPAEKKVAHVLEMFNQTGSVGFKPIDLDQPEPFMRDNSPPLVPHAGYIGELERLSKQIDWHKNDMAETLGLNDALLGNPTGERQSVGGLKIQAQSGQNALGFMFDIFDEIEEQVALQEYGMFQCAMQSGVELEGYVKLLGQPAGKVIRFSAKNDPGSIGVKAVMHMTDEQEAWMREVVQQSIGAGQIDAVDGAMVMKEHNFNLALQKLRLRIDTKAKQAQENQMQLVQAQGQSVQQSTKMTVDGKAAETQAKVEAQMAIAQQKAETELDLFDRKQQAEIQKELLIEQRENAKTQAMIMSTLNELMIKVKSQERMAREANESKERIAEDANETAEEIAEKQAAAARSRPSPKG